MEKLNNPIADLREQLLAYNEANPHKYDKALLEAFYLFWDKSVDGKPRWEHQKTWSLKGRLSTWDRNNTRYQKKNKLDMFRRLASKLDPMR